MSMEPIRALSQREGYRWQGGLILAKDAELKEHSLVHSMGTAPRRNAFPHLAGGVETMDGGLADRKNSLQERRGMGQGLEARTDIMKREFDGRHDRRFNAAHGQQS